MSDNEEGDSEDRDTDGFVLITGEREEDDVGNLELGAIQVDQNKYVAVQRNAA